MILFRSDSMRDAATDRICHRCGDRTTEFYSTGNVCKPCIRSSVRSNYRRNRAHYVAYDKRRELTDSRRVDKSESMIRHRAKNPEKYRARTAVGNALRDGKIERMPCECGETKVQAHHHDYSKPLEVTWLCVKCHWSHHGGVTP